jgi:hypothetical protein
MKEWVANVVFSTQSIDERSGGETTQEQCVSGPQVKFRDLGGRQTSSSSSTALLFFVYYIWLTFRLQ